MRLEWSRFAMADRDAIFDYIEADNPLAAIAMDDRIRDHVDSLLRFPESGRPGRFPGTRELAVGRTPYIAIYSSADGLIRLLRLPPGAKP